MRRAAAPEFRPAGGEASRRAILIIAISAIAVETALLGMVAPLLPEIEERTGVGDAALSLTMTAYAIPIVLISIPAGRIADRVGRRPLLLSGLLLTGLGSLLIASSESLWPLLAGRAVQGVGSTGSWVAALALVSDLARPGRKGEAIGFALSANSFGAIGGPALGGIVGGSISFSAPFLAVSVVSAGLFLGGLFVLPRGPASEAAPVSSLVGFWAGLRHKGVLVPVAASLLGALFFGFVDFAVPLDLDRRLGIAATAIGLLFAGVALLDVVTSPLGGMAGDRLGRAPVVLAGAAGLLASGALLLVLPGLAGASVAMAAFGIGQALLFAGTVPWLDDAFGGVRRGLAYGGLNMIFAVGYTLGPLAAGAIMEVASADVVYALIGGGALGLIAAIRRVAPDRPRPGPPHQRAARAR